GPPRSGGAAASSSRAGAEARAKRWERVGWEERASPLSPAGREKVTRKGGTGRSRLLWFSRHAWAWALWHWGPWRVLPEGEREGGSPQGSQEERWPPRGAGRAPAMASRAFKGVGSRRPPLFLR